MAPLLLTMSTMTRRHSRRRSHHPLVACDTRGRWHWSCGCGAGARGASGPADWHWAVTGALVHQSLCPGE